MKEISRLNRELNNLLSKVITIENEISNLDETKDSKDVDYLKNKLKYVKSEVYILENNLNKLGVSNSVNSQASTTSKTTVNSPVKEEFNKTSNSKPSSNSISIKPVKESNEIVKFVKDNVLLLTFSSFVFIGLVWLFVYISSLSNFSNEVRVIAGFVISLLLIGFPYVRKVKDNVNIILTLTGYIIGLLVILFGTIYLEVISQYLAIVISLGYISYGIYKTIKFNSEFFNIVILLSSLLLTFAYYYVSAPIEILFSYIIILVICFTFVLKKQKAFVSTLVLFSASFFTGLILMNMTDNVINDKFESLYEKEISGYSYGFFTDDYAYQDDYEEDGLNNNGTYEFDDEGYEKLGASLMKKYEDLLISDYLITLGSPLLLLLTLIYSLYVLRENFSKNTNGIILFNSILGSLYLFEFSFILSLFNLNYLYSDIGTIHLVFMSILAVIGLVSLLIFIKLKDNDLIGFSYVTFFVGLITVLLSLDSFYDNTNTLILISVLLSFIMLLIGLYQSVFNLKILGIIYSVLNVILVLGNYYFTSDTSDSLFTFKLFNFIILVLGSIAVSYIYYKFYKNYLNNIVDEKLYGKYNIFTQLYSSIPVVTLVLLFVEFGNMIGQLLEGEFLIYSLWMIVPLVIIYLVLHIPNKTDKLNYVVPYVLSLIIFAISIITITFDTSFNSEKVFNFMYVIELLLFVIYVSFLYVTLYLRKNSTFMFIDNNIFGSPIYMRSALNLYILYITFNFIGSLFSNYIDSEILYNVLVGASIIYILYDISLIEKLNNVSKTLYIYLYSLIGFYLFVLIFILLADMPFIIRGIIFLAIGIYGLFINLKNKKNVNNENSIKETDVEYSDSDFDSDDNK